MQNTWDMHSPILNTIFSIIYRRERRQFCGSNSVFFFHSFHIWLFVVVVSWKACKYMTYYFGILWIDERTRKNYIFEIKMSDNNIINGSCLFYSLLSSTIALQKCSTLQWFFPRSPDAECRRLNQFDAMCVYLPTAAEEVLELRAATFFCTMAVSPCMESYCWFPHFRLIYGWPTFEWWWWWLKASSCARHWHWMKMLNNSWMKLTRHHFIH